MIRIINITKFDKNYKSSCPDIDQSDIISCSPNLFPPGIFWKQRKWLSPTKFASIDDSDVQAHRQSFWGGEEEESFVVGVYTSQLQSFLVFDHCRNFAAGQNRGEKGRKQKRRLQIGDAKTISWFLADANTTKIVFSVDAIKKKLLVVKSTFNSLSHVDSKNLLPQVRFIILKISVILIIIK